jgi:dTDP-4-amino-4,6-dideoxygalactose transaminase
MDRIMDIADRHGLKVIEDCCQAYFTYYKGRLAGTIGDMGCFSMQQSKHLTARTGTIWPCAPPYSETRDGKIATNGVQDPIRS